MRYRLAWASSILTCLMVFSSCSMYSPYAHDLPLTYRSVLFEASKSETIDACSRALVCSGYTIACEDTVSGLVFTEYRVLPPESKEIGGTGRIQCLLLVTEMADRSMVTAEIVPETEAGAGWHPVKVRYSEALAKYKALFKGIQDQLEVKSRVGG